MNILFKRSRIFYGIDIYEEFLFTKCQECSKTTMAIDELIWKNYYLCEGCYISHSEERNQIRNKVEKHKPLNCSICRFVKKHHEHRYAYHPHNVFETDCIDSMIRKGIDTDKICKSADKFEPLCIECYDTVLYLEEKRKMTELKQECKDKQRVQDIYKEHTDEAYLILREEFKDKYKGIIMD